MNTDGTLTNWISGRPALAMLGVLFAILVVFTIDVGYPNPDRSMERICMASSQETWMRQRAGESDAWKTPSIAGGALRVRKPPLLVWLNMAAWADLDPETAPLTQLMFRARLVTILLVLLGVVSTGLVGWMFAGGCGGFLSALIAGSMFLVSKYANYTSYDAHLMGWAGLCVACGVWAAQPIQPNQWRGHHWLGWIGCGLALGAAVMTKGPVAVIYAVLPLAWMIAVVRENRGRNIMGIAAALILAALVWSSWLWHVLQISKGALGTLRGYETDLFSEYSGMDKGRYRPIYEYLIIIAAVVPWTLWWGAGLIQPFRAKPWQQDRPLWLAWGWFVTSFVTIALWPMRSDRYLVPVMPGAALLTAMWLMGQMERNPEPPVWMTRSWKILWIICAIVSIGFPIFMLLEALMLSRKWLREELLAPVAWPVLVAATLGLMGLVIFGWRAITQKKQFVLCVALGLWMVLLNGIVNHGHNRAARHIPVYQKDIASLFEATRGMNVYYLADAGNKFTQPDLGFYIHSRRIIRPLATEQIRQLTTEGKPFAVLVVSNSDGEKKLSESGLKSQLSIRDKNVRWTLYRFGSGFSLDLLEPAPSLVSRGYVEGS